MSLLLSARGFRLSSTAALAPSASNRPYWTSHYAPRHALRLRAERVAGDEGLLAFGPRPLTGAAKTLNLSPAGDLGEAAARLFAALHELDRADVAGIAVMQIPDDGLGAAINDRLERAAASPSHPTPPRDVDR